MVETASAIDVTVDKSSNGSKTTSSGRSRRETSGATSQPRISARCNEIIPRLSVMPETIILAQKNETSFRCSLPRDDRRRKLEYIGQKNVNWHATDCPHPSNCYMNIIAEPKDVASSDSGEGRQPQATTPAKATQPTPHRTIPTRGDNGLKMASPYQEPRPIERRQQRQQHRTWSGSWDGTAQGVSTPIDRGKRGGGGRRTTCVTQKDPPSPSGQRLTAPNDGLKSREVRA